MNSQFNRPQPYKTGSPHPQASLPAGYLKEGYFDKNGNVLKEVIIDWPREIARTLDENGMAVAQLRNFFAEARRIEKQLDAGAAFSTLKERLWKLVSLAQFAVIKGFAPLIFKQFIEKNLIWADKDDRGFSRGFINHFESVVAYFPRIK